MQIVWRSGVVRACTECVALKYVLRQTTFGLDELEQDL